MDTEETRLYYILWIAAILLAVIIISFIRVMMRNQADSIKSMQHQLDLQVRSSDEDRLKIVGELHDDIGPYLSALSCKLELLQLETSDSPRLVVEAAQISEHLIHSTRGLTRIFLPYNVSTNDLAVAVKNFIYKLNNDKLTISFESNNIPLLRQDYLISICRLVQEIIHNSIKHSKAGDLRINIKYDKYTLTIRTAEENWGKISKYKKNRYGVGKELMESRIRLLNGNMHMDLSESHGTRYVITIPLPHETHYHEKTN